jgi:CO/xanthine dehydrogenase Mo-binding subunit
LPLLSAKAIPKGISFTWWRIAGRDRVEYLLQTYVATVVEVEVNRNGDVRIPRVDIAVDAGRAIDPDRVKAQFEGAPSSEPPSH